MLSDRRPLCLSVCLSVCNVSVSWLNGWMDQDETWHGGRPRPRPHCVKWRPSSSPLQKRIQPQIFGPCLLWPKSWKDQDATWYTEVDLGPGHIVLDGDPAPPKEAQQPPSFWHVSIVAKGSPISATAEHLFK